MKKKRLSIWVVCAYLSRWVRSMNHRSPSVLWPCVPPSDGEYLFNVRLCRLWDSPLLSTIVPSVQSLCLNTLLKVHLLMLVISLNTNTRQLGWGCFISQCSTAYSPLRPTLLNHWMSECPTKRLLMANMHVSPKHRVIDAHSGGGPLVLCDTFQNWLTKLP